MKRELIRICSSPKLFVYSLVWLMVLVTVGTVAQKDIGLYASQQKYFSSYFFFIGPLPLPGGRVVLALMLINLVSMMFKQNLWKMSRPLLNTQSNRRTCITAYLPFATLGRRKAQL